MDPHPLAMITRFRQERRVGFVIAATLILLIGSAATTAIAQEAAADITSDQAASTDSAAGEQIAIGRMPTIEELYRTSPYINTGILVLSVIALIMFLYLFLAVTSRGFSPPRLVDNVTKLVLNRQFDQAIHLCQNNSGAFVSSIFQRIIENRDRDHAVLIDMISTEGRRRSEPIWNRVNLLSEISNIAPMLGLLGTIYGMIQVFFTLTTEITGQKASQLAGGIGTAMSTTLFGVIVAIVAGLFYTVLRSRVTTVLAEAEQVCHSLADHTARSAVDPRLKKIDALADAARQKIAKVATRSPTSGAAAVGPAVADPLARPTQS